VSASDVVDGNLTSSVVCTPLSSGSTFPIAETTVSCSVEDAAGNEGSNSFKVTVQDTTKPELTLPSDITKEATGPSGAVVEFKVSASDVVDGNLTSSVVCTPLSSGSTFPIAETTVSCSVEDAAKNTESGSFKVTVLDYLEGAKKELNDLRAYVQNLRDTGKIGQKEYEHFMKDLDKIQQDIEKAKQNLDTARYGYDDKIKGFEDLRHVVTKLEHVIKDVQDWLKKGKIAAVNANQITNELEKIRMKMVNKARAEALEEKALALKAIKEAKAAGKDTTKAEQEIAKVDQQLAKAEQKILQGKLAQAIQHFKHAFAHSDHAIKKAYDPKWTIDYKDWIDELEEMNP
jgi:hypothetical protein